jgi:hypothetical protein
MPRNPETGKTDRRTLSEVELLDFRLKQAEERGTEVKRGKRRARDAPGASEQEGSGPSPLAPVAALGALALDSGGSSAANTPDDSPASLPQPPLPEHPTLPSAPEARKASKPSAGKPASNPPTAAPTHHPTGLVVEASGASRLLNTAHLQAESSHRDASPASDDASSGARISQLEVRLGEVEKWAEGVEGRLRLLGV